MRTLRWIGMAVVAILMSVNFAACSDDDDVDVSLLEGTWGLVHNEGYEGEDSWNDQYDPTNPNSDREDSKVVIAKATGNTYSMTAYYYDRNGWNAQTAIMVTLDGNILTPAGDDSGEVTKILVLNETQLVVETTGEYAGEKYYEKSTYKRM